MTKEELIQFLRENLSINLSSQDGGCYDSASFTVKLLLDGEEISESYCTLPRERESDRY